MSEINADQREQLRELAEKITGNDIRRIRTWSDKQPGFDIARMVGQVLDILEMVPALLTALDSAEKREKELDRTADELMKESGTFEEWADKLADAISEKFDVPIGEHSNMNCPWAVALGILNGEYVTAAESALSTERERVIEECATFVKDWLETRTVTTFADALDIIAAIRALHSPEVAPKSVATEERMQP